MTTHNQVVSDHHHARLKGDVRPPPCEIERRQATTTMRDPKEAHKTIVTRD